jgi:hypothetical protein
MNAQPASGKPSARLAQHSTFNARRTKRHRAKSLRKSGTEETLSIHPRIPKKGKASVRSSSFESAALLW